MAERALGTIEEWFVKSQSAYVSFAFKISPQAESVDTLANALTDAAWSIGDVLRCGIRGRTLQVIISSREAMAALVTSSQSSDTSNEDEIASILGSEVTKGVNTEEGRPLWHATVLNKAWVVCTYHHAIVDGMTASEVIVRTAHILNGRASSTLQSSDLLPPLEDALGNSAKLGRLGGLSAAIAGRLIVKAKKPVAPPSAPVEHLIEATAPASARTTCCVLGVVSSAVQKLVEACRHRNSTLTSVLVSGLTLAILEIFEKKEINDIVSRESTSNVVAVEVSIDARQFIDANASDKKYFGAYVSSLSLGTSPPDKRSSLWALAASEWARPTPSKKTATKFCQLLAWSNRMIKDEKSTENILDVLFDCDGPTQGRTSTANVSNLGQIGTNKSEATVDRSHDINRVFFLSCQRKFGVLFNLGVSSCAGDLCLCLGFVEPIISHEKASAVLQRLIARLEDPRPDA